MSTENFEYEQVQTIEEAFPNVDPDVEPLGGRVLIQLRRIPKRTKSGLILVEETKDTVKWNNQIALVRKLGPLAFRNRQNMEPWAEGAWVKPGDFVRVPRWNGDRIEVRVKDEEDPIVFVVFNDHELITKINGDPLRLKTYIL